MAIVTYDEAAQFVGAPALSADLAFKLTVDATAQQVSDWCNREFTYGQFVETASGLGELSAYRSLQLITQGVYPYLYVRNYPITALIEVRIDPFALFGVETVYDITRFSFIPGPRGGNRIIWADGLFFSGAFQRVTYKAGYLDANGYGGGPIPAGVPAMPASLRLGTLKAIGAQWERGSGQAAESERIGDYNYTLMTQRQDAGLNPFWMDSSVESLLQEHRSYV